MKNSLLAELTNKYIDNELNADEQISLERLLENAKNKNYFESMVRTLSELTTHKPAVQEIDIKNLIVSKINKQKEDRIMSKVKSWWSQTFNGTKLSYAASFALGAVFVSLVFLFQPTTETIDDSFMRGTIANRNFDETYFLNESSFEGAVKVQRSQNMVILDVNLSTSELVDCELTYDKNLFALYGVKSVEENSNGKFSSGGSSVRLSNLESNHYMVFLRVIENSPSKVHASFYEGSAKISSLTIDLKY